MIFGGAWGRQLAADGVCRRQPVVATARAVVRLNPCVAKVAIAASRILWRVCERPDPARGAISVSGNQSAAGTDFSDYLNVRSEHMFKTRRAGMARRPGFPSGEVTGPR
jgi:hypothetical protein